jgi:hypothetical protein
MVVPVNRKRAITMDVDDPMSSLPEQKLKDAEVMKYMRELLTLFENENGLW